MVLRFRRSIRILPGIRVNLSKSGASVSVGGRGATVNVSKRGVTRTVGIPGTGISDRTVISRPHQDRHDGDLVQPMPPRRGHALQTIVSVIMGLTIVVLIFALIFSGQH